MAGRDRFHTIIKGKIISGLKFGVVRDVLKKSRSQELQKNKINTAISLLTELQ